MLAGQMLLDGEGGAADPAAALPLVRQACDAGEPYGCANLGRMLVFGLGVEADVQAGAALVADACRAGVQPACDLLRSP